MQKIEGIPDGWKLKRVGRAVKGDYVLVDGEPRMRGVDFDSLGIYYAIIEPDNVYGKPLDEVTIPNGWEKVGYRVPAVGEWFISCHRSAMKMWHLGDGHSLGNRIIIKKKPTTKRLHITVDIPVETVVSTPPTVNISDDFTGDSLELSPSVWIVSKPQAE